MGQCLPWRGERRTRPAARPLVAVVVVVVVVVVGVDIMRSNSARDESRNNLRDPTMRDRKRARTTPQRKAKAPADHRGGRKD